MSISRLLLPALALWSGALGCLLFASAPILETELCCRCAVVGALVALLGCALAAWRRPQWRSSRALAITTSLAIGLLAAAFHLLPMVAEPVTSLAESREVVAVTGVVESEGRAIASRHARLWQSAPEYRFQLASTTMTAGLNSWEIHLPMQVISQELPPPIGSVVRLRGAITTGRLPISAAVVRQQGSITVLDGPGLVDQVADGLRTGLREAVAERPTDAASLVAGLTIGDQGQQSPQLMQAMRTAGLSHLTAVSGGNVAVIVVLVMGLARWCRLRLSAQVACCLIALAWFVVLVRPQPSVLRASTMGAVVLVGLLTGGQRRGTGVLAVCIAALIVIAPELAVSWGFALSVAATGGLILGSPHVLWWLQWRLHGWPTAVLEGLAVTITAQLATLPLVIAMGSTVGLASIPANLLAMPVVPIVTVLGLITAALGVLLPPVAVLTGLVASWFASWIAQLAYASSALPLAVLPWPVGWGGAGVLLLLAAAALVLRQGLRRRFPSGIPAGVSLAIVAIGLAIALLLPWLASPRAWPMSDWIFAACDVGQGDALAVRTGEHSAMLIDAGLDARDVDQCLRRLSVSTLDVVVLSHFHADHVGGLMGALHERAVGAVFATPTKDPAGEAQLVTSELSERGLTVHDVHVRELHAIGELTWQVLWPSRHISAGSIPNNASVVLLIEVDGVRILLPGDIEPEAQAALMAEHPPVHADIAKIPHHGSRFQDPGFAFWAGGRLAIASVGLGNDYGHPAATTTQQWEQAGAQVLRTDLQGSIAVTREADGSLGVVTFKE